MKIRIRKEKMAPKKIFVRVPGDLIASEKLFASLSQLRERAKKLVICVGGINNGITTANDLMRSEHNNMELDTQTLLEGYRGTLEKSLIEKFGENEMKATGKISVIIPIIRLGEVRCFLTDNQLFSIAMNGFDESYIVTKKENVSLVKYELSDFHYINMIMISN